MHFFLAYDAFCHLLVVILHRQTKKLDNVESLSKKI